MSVENRNTLIMVAFTAFLVVAISYYGDLSVADYMALFRKLKQ